MTPSAATRGENIAANSITIKALQSTLDLMAPPGRWVSIVDGMPARVCSPPAYALAHFLPLDSEGNKDLKASGPSNLTTAIPNVRNNLHSFVHGRSTAS